MATETANTPAVPAPATPSADVAAMLAELREMHQEMKALLRDLRARQREGAFRRFDLLMDEGPDALFARSPWAMVEAPEVGPDGNLQRAAKEGWVGSVKRWIQDGAEVNAPDRNGNTPLHLAIERGHVAVVEALLDFGVECGLPNRHGVTPLRMAWDNNQPAIADLLLTKGKVLPTAEDLAYRQKLQANALARELHAAVVQGQEDVVGALLDQGATFQAARDGDEPPLFAAIRVGNLSMVDLLLRRGADHNTLWHYESPLVAAIDKGATTMVEQLLAAGASVNPDYPARNPLYRAIVGGEPAIVQLLRSARARLPKEYPEGAELHVAVRETDGPPERVAALVKSLLDVGCDPELRVQKRTALEAAKSARGWNGKHYQAIKDVFQAHAAQQSIPEASAGLRFDPR